MHFAMTYRDRVSLISAQQPHSTISGQAFLLWGPHCLHLWTRGVILDLLLLPKAGLSPSIQNVTWPDYGVCEPTAQVFPPSLQLAGTPDELLSLPGFTFLVYRVGICTD